MIFKMLKKTTKLKEIQELCCEDMTLEVSIILNLFLIFSTFGPQYSYRLILIKTVPITIKCFRNIL